MSRDERIELLSRKVNNVNKILVAHGIGKEDREDLLQEVFILAFRSIEKLKDVDKMDSWLWTIAENRVKMYFKELSKKRSSEVHMDEEVLERISAESQNLVDLDQVAKSIDRLVTQEELRTALLQLDRNTLTIFNLHYGLEYRLVEIAKAQGRNYSSVKSAHTRGLEKLRRIIEQEGAFKDE